MTLISSSGLNSVGPNDGPLNQTAVQPKNTQAVPKAVRPATVANAPALQEDRFTPTTQGAANVATSTQTGPIEVRTQLQTLNNALAALGLDRAEIQKVDRIASSTGDFSPAAFTSLAYQLEALARDLAQRPAATSTAPAVTAPPAAGSVQAANGVGVQASTAPGVSPANPNASAGGTAHGVRARVAKS